MLPTTSADVLLVARVHGEELRAAAAAHRLRERPPRRRTLADLLRQAADRLDAAPRARPGLAP